MRSRVVALALWVVACAAETTPEPRVTMSGSAGAAGMAAVAGAPAPAGAAASAAVPDPTGFDGVRLLSQTGLYTNTLAQTLAAGVVPYEPLGQLWADGAVKRRWILLPAGTRIDTADMDAWRYPIGTKLWKEFALAGMRIETRLIEKVAEAQWRMVSYAWNAEQTDASAAPLGMINAAGTQHDIPDTDACKQCHDGLPDRVLGFTALQLAHPAAGMTLDRLISEAKLTVNPSQLLKLPGDTVEQTALAYLHANCGHCHRPDRERAEREISVYLWQESKSVATVRDTVTYTSLVKNKRSPLWLDSVLTRMQQRGGLEQMPPLATKLVDQVGVEAVRAWLMRVRPDFAPSLPLAPIGPSARCDGVEKIFAIFERAACRSAFCHGAGTGELDFTTPEQLHASMVGVRASGEGCMDLPLARVQPGAPEQSLLMIKLQPGPPCGKIMPPAALQALTGADIEAVSAWIAGCTP